MILRVTVTGEVECHETRSRSESEPEEGAETVGVDSPDDLTKSKLGEYGEMQHGWTADDAKGFIKVLSTPLRAYYGMHPGERE